MGLVPYLEKRWMHRSCYEIILSGRNWKITTVPDQWRYPIQLYILDQLLFPESIYLKSLIPVHFRFVTRTATLVWSWSTLMVLFGLQKLFYTGNLSFYLVLCSFLKDQQWFNPFNHNIYVYKLILSKGFNKHEFTCEASKDQAYFL